MAIANLELERSDIEDIQEKKEDVTIYNFRVLKKWQEKEQSNATAQNLYNCLKSISVEVQDVLKGEQEILLVIYLESGCVFAKSQFLLQNVLLAYL